jgi:hypothetical protein
MSTDADSLEAALVDEGGDLLDFQYLPDPKQLDLLRDKQGNLPRDALQTLRSNNGPGRPKGARNKASKQVAKYFISKYGNPLDVLGEIINTPVDLMVDQLKLAQGGEAKHKPVRAMDAVNLRLRAVDIVMPYLYGKQPITVDVNGKADVILNIAGMTDPAHLASYADGGELSAEALEQIQVADFTEAGDE